MRTILPRLAVAALTLTGLLTFVTVASAASSTTYGGTTSQKQGGSPLRLTLTVSRGAVSNVQVAALVRTGAPICAVNITSSSLVFSKGKAKINRSHRFSGKLTDGHGDSMTITGLAKSARVSGSFVVKSTGGASGATTCNSGKVMFGAQASGGQADHTKYSGTTGPAFPLSFRVSANGRAVDDLVVHYEVTTCGAAPGNVAPAYHFGALAIKSGTFSGSVTSRSGNKESVSLRITGRFFGRVATGTVTARQHITSLPTCTESERFTAKAK
jgi:hypothetical protein